jgi:hypothetical protein
VEVASTTATVRLQMLPSLFPYVAASPPPLLFVVFSIASPNIPNPLYPLYISLSLRTLYWWCFTPFLSPIWHSLCSRPSLLPRLAAPIRHRSEKKAGAYLPINAPSHQTSTSPHIHRRQSPTSYRQPRNNSSIFRIANVRHGWRQGKIIWRKVVGRQGRSRRRKEATEPLEQGWSPG